MPQVSVVTIARNERDLRKLKEALKKQTFKDFELVYSTKKGIPQAMNDAISKAKGEIIVITETDAMPMTNTWLEEMVNAVKKENRNDKKKRTLVRGIEVTPSTWDWSNFAAYANVMKENKLDESFPIAEDTELYARLRKRGYKGVELPIAPVLHERSNSVSKMIRNNFLYGILLVKIQMKYGQAGFKSNFKGSGKKNAFSLLKRELGLIVSKIGFLLGTLIGAVLYYPTRKK
ncbi:MAG: glycosyltransferase [Candidatus Aenigmarchaeota archaeon]|nr:glycosyltransferase [Candidatus Aenigmarchaeota archaeon]